METTREVLFSCMRLSLKFKQIAVLSVKVAENPEKIIRSSHSRVIGRDAMCHVMHRYYANGERWHIDAAVVPHLKKIIEIASFMEGKMEMLVA